MPSRESFPEDLKAYRKSNGLTQADLARLLDFSPETISAWERGKRKPHIQQIPRLARLLQVDVEQLLQSINADFDKAHMDGNIAQLQGYEQQQGGLVTVFASQDACEMQIREAARMARIAKILTIRGEKYFMGPRSLLHNLCIPGQKHAAHVQVLVLAPDSSHISEQLATRIDHETPEEIRERMWHSLGNLKFHARRNKDFEVRCYREAPNFKLLLFEDTLFVTSFVKGGPKNDQSAKMFQMMREGNPLFPGFGRYFDDLWGRSTLPE